MTLPIDFSRSEKYLVFIHFQRALFSFTLMYSFSALFSPSTAVKYAPKTPDMTLGQSKSYIASLKSVGKNAYKYTPGFVYFFLLMVLLRTFGDLSLESSKEKANDHSTVGETAPSVFGVMSGETWKKIIKVLSEPVATTILLTSAMAALGLSTNLTALKGVGAKPFILGGAAASALALSGFAVTYASILFKQHQLKTQAQEQSHVA